MFPKFRPSPAMLMTWIALTGAMAGADDQETTYTVETLAAKVRPSVVVISVPDRDGQEKHLGTGFVISPEGLIATNLHVIGEGRPITVRTADKKKLSVVAVHASDRNLDLAIVRVEKPESPLVSLTPGDSENIQDGTPVVVMGNPHGLEHSVVNGVISGRRDIEGRDMLQLAVPIEPGNSGGPVLDMQGAVHGVVTMKSAVKQNLGFAVAASDLQLLIDKPNPVPMEQWRTIGQISPARWQTLFGARWQQRGGRILVEGSGEGFGGRALCLSKSDPPAIPFEVAVSVKLSEESGAAGLVFHADGKDKHYGFYPSAGKLRLSRFQGPNVFTWQVLREVPSEHYRPGEWNHLKVRVEEDKLLCYVNDHLVIESRDQGFREGQIGLAQFRKTQAQFKRFEFGKSLQTSRVSAEQTAELEKTIDALPPLASLVPEDTEALEKNAETSVAIALAKAKQLESQAQELRQLANDVRIRAIGQQIQQTLATKPVALLQASLLISQIDEQEIDVKAYLAAVQQMVESIQADLKEDASSTDKLKAMDDYLFKQQGFHGSRFDYYHRANSYMNRVIDDRVGLPITLAVLYMELGRRLGVTIDGVGLPGHFIVKHVPEEGDAEWIDVFDDARRLSQEDMKKIVRDFAGREYREQDSQTATPQDILIRMLGNLRGLAERERNKEAILRYLEVIVAVDEEAIAERGMRAVMRFETGRRQAAITDLDWFLEHEPPGLDLDQIRNMRDYFIRGR